MRPMGKMEHISKRLVAQHRCEIVKRLVAQPGCGFVEIGNKVGDEAGSHSELLKQEWKTPVREQQEATTDPH